MSSPNLELVRSIYSQWERGEYRSNDWADPQIEFVFADGPMPGTWTGLDGMATAWRAWLSSWEDFRQAAIDFRELDDERVVVRFQASGRGRISGVELERLSGAGAGVFHVRGGRVVKFVVHLDGTKAPAA